MKDLKNTIILLLNGIFKLCVVTGVVWLLYNYIIAPAFNIQTIGYWVMFAILYIIAMIGSLLRGLKKYN